MFQPPQLTEDHEMASGSLAPQNRSVTQSAGQGGNLKLDKRKKSLHECIEEPVVGGNRQRLHVRGLLPLAFL
jgi:hypothetical protein